METWVMNLETESERWERMQDQLAVYHIRPHRFLATPDNLRIKPPWLGPKYSDVSRRQAIIKTYHGLMQHLQGRAADRFLVLQDGLAIQALGDMPDSRLNILGGWHPKRPNAITNPKHICPRGFIVHRSLLPDLEEAWSDMTRQVCETWIPVVKRHATFAAALDVLDELEVNVG